MARLAPQRGAATTARLTIDIPKKSASSVSRSPKYISAATQSITLNVTPQGRLDIRQRVSGNRELDADIDWLCVDAGIHAMHHQPRAGSRQL
jgi:hypothetical protein